MKRRLHFYGNTYIVINYFKSAFSPYLSSIASVFWNYVKEHLTKHEYQRFAKLKLVNTDCGRGRAWLRASLNEHSLERYMHMLIERDELLA